MTPRSIVAWLLASVWLLVLPAWAVEYRLQVTNLDYRTFSKYLENSSPAWRGEERMGGLEVRLDTQEFPTSAVLPGREVQLLEDPRYGGKAPARVSLLPATRDQSWTTFVWEGNPGDTAAFVVKTDMVAWQEVWSVAAIVGEGLRRLSIGGPGLFGHQWQQVPEVSYTFLANAVDQGAFTAWVERNAKPIDGMYVAVGRGYNRFYSPDRLYTLIKLPPESHTFKLVIGWKDWDDRGTGFNGSGNIIR
jgi:hypothetical protein